MATAGVLMQTKAQVVEQGSPNRLEWLVKDLDGAPLDISAGFTAAFIVAPLRGQGIAGSAHAGTFAYGADGVLSLTMTQAQTSNDTVGRYEYDLRISDDAMVSYARAAKGPVQFNAFLE